MVCNDFLSCTIMEYEGVFLLFANSLMSRMVSYFSTPNCKMIKCIEKNGLSIHHSENIGICLRGLYFTACTEKNYDLYLSRKKLFPKYIEIFLTFTWYLYNNVYMVCIVRLILLYLGLCFYSLMILFWSIHRILLHPRHPKHYHLALFRMLNGFCHEQHLPIQQMETKIVNRNTSL